MLEFHRERDVVYIGRGAVLKGEVIASHVVVDGTVDGRIVCQSLMIGADGKALGAIEATEVVVGGAVKARLVVHQTITARASARISGEWRCREIVAERGAVLNGAAKTAVEDAASGALFASA